MKPLFYLLILATPLALTIVAFIAIPPTIPGDFLGYVLGDTENTLCLPRSWMEEGR